MNERRRDLRCEKSTSLRLYDARKEPLDDGPLLRDVCARGLGFETAAPLKPGDIFWFRMQVPQRGIIAGSAVARWMEPVGGGGTYRCGAEIEEISWSNQRVLRRYLNPPSPVWGQCFDLALMGGVLWVWTLATRDIQATDPRFFEGVSRALQSYLEWLPQVGIALTALLGIIVVLKRS